MLRTIDEHCSEYIILCKRLAFSTWRRAVSLAWRARSRELRLMGIGRLETIDTTMRTIIFGLSRLSGTVLCMPKREEHVEETVLPRSCSVRHAVHVRLVGRFSISIPLLFLPFASSASFPSSVGAIIGFIHISVRSTPLHNSTHTPPHDSLLSLYCSASRRFHEWTDLSLHFVSFRFSFPFLFFLSFFFFFGTREYLNTRAFNGHGLQ